MILLGKFLLPCQLKNWRTGPQKMPGIIFLFNDTVTADCVGNSDGFEAAGNVDAILPSASGAMTAANMIKQPADSDPA